MNKVWFFVSPILKHYSYAIILRRLIGCSSRFDRGRSRITWCCRTYNPFDHSFVSEGRHCRPSFRSITNLIQVNFKQFNIMEYYLNIIITRFLLGWCLVVALALKAKCQSNVEAQNVDVTYNKTSSIVFPAIIKSVDRGSRDVLAQKAKGVENVLQVKAARKDFPQTNLTVITDDGVLHHFTVNYSEQPATLTLIAVQLTEPPADPLIFQQNSPKTI